MGAWGYGPFDNDTAGDMAAGLAKHVQAVADHKKNADYAAARFATHVLLSCHGTDILGGPSLDPAVHAYAWMRGDVQYLVGAREPKKIARVLETEMRAVLARMKKCKGCRRGHDKKAWAVLDGIVADACAVPVPKASGPKMNRNEGLRRRRRKKTK